jgi:hypothetical protein
MHKTLSLLQTGIGASLLAVVMLLGALSPSALAAPDPCDTQSVCFQGAVVSGVRVEPPALFLTSDGSLQIVGMNWSTWASEVAATPDVARGTGLAVYETMGRGNKISVHVVPVAVVLSQSVACDPALDVPNGLYFNKVTLTNQRTHRPFARSYLRRVQWAPCE